MGSTKADILAAFKLFDKDGSGSLDASEFKAILTKPGETALSDEDAQAIINDFDTNGDGVLQFKEFVAAWSKLCGKIEANEEYQTDMYDRRVEPHKEAIARIFGKLDEDKSGDLSGAEVEEVISLYQGTKYDHDEFMGWYDTHGGNPDGTWDVKEFGWYIADCAECDPDKMEATIASFEESVDYVLDHKVEDRASKK